MTPRPDPEDWFRVLFAARAVLHDFECDAPETFDELQSEVELRASLRRCAAHVGVPWKMLDVSDGDDTGAFIPPTEEK